MFIQTEDTPNPSVMKFLPGREVLASGTREFRGESDAMASPLAVDLFDIPGVTRVFYGTDFVTVTKDDDSEWPHLKAPILAAIMDHFTSGVAQLLLGVSLLSGGVGGGALLMLITDWMARLTIRYARLHFRLFDTATAS